MLALFFQSSVIYNLINVWNSRYTMRIWDLKPEILCDKHLLGEHRELHAIWSVLTLNKTG